MDRSLMDQDGDRDAVKGHVGHDARHQSLGAPDQRRQHEAEEEESGELQRLAVGQGEERRAEDDAEHDAGAGTTSEATFTEGSKEHATKEPLLHYGRQERRHNYQEDKTR